VAKCWFVAQEEHLTEILVLVGFNCGDTVQGGPLKVELHHDAESLGEAGVHAKGEVEAADFAGFDEPGERGYPRRSVLPLGLSCLSAR
jgi:hypothetical protein